MLPVYPKTNLLKHFLAYIRQHLNKTAIHDFLARLSKKTCAKPMGYFSSNILHKNSREFSEIGTTIVEVDDDHDDYQAQPILFCLF